MTRQLAYTEQCIYSRYTIEAYRNKIYFSEIKAYP
jgi:hypothetical protein